MPLRHSLTIALAAATLCAAAAQVAAAPRPPRPTFPAAFQGEWNGSLRQCYGNTDDTRLTIAPRRITFYESSGTLRTLTRVNATTIRIVSAMSGEGETYTSRFTFRVSAHGRTLTDISGAEPFVRYRCPVARP